MPRRHARLAALAGWLALAGGAGTAAAAMPETWVEAAANTHSVFLGQSFRVTLTAGIRQGEVRLPRTAILWPGCKVRAYRETDVSSRHEGYNARQGLYTLAAFDLDEINIPPLPVQFAWPNGTTAGAQAPGWTIAVAAEAAHGGLELRDPRPARRAFPWDTLAGAGVAAAGAAGGWVWWRRRPSRRPRGGPAPHLEAFVGLDALGKSRIVADGRMNDYFTELSRILRHYVSRRWGLMALKQPRAAILRALAAQQVPEKPLRLIRGLLFRADLVKFAQARVDFARIAEAHQKARRFIEMTRPSPEGAPQDIRHGI